MSDLPLPVPLHEGVLIAFIKDLRGGGFDPSGAEAMMGGVDGKFRFGTL